MSWRSTLPACRDTWPEISRLTGSSSVGHLWDEQYRGRRCVELVGQRHLDPLAGPATQHQLRSTTAYILDGPRGPACLRLVIGMDVSGSMADFAEARDSALHQLQEWARAPRTLRPNDQIAIVDFAFEAAIRFPPTPVAQSPTSAAVAVDDGTETLLRPMLEQTKRFPASDCDSVLLLLSDAQISDLPVNSDEGDRLLREYGVHDIRFLVPGDTIAVPEEWSRAFPVPRRSGSTDWTRRAPP